MCGIVGYQSLEYFKENRGCLEIASLALVHRGPDDCGYFYDKKSGIGLAHRRLAIIDTSVTGRQPMASDDGNIQIVYNGEIYNFQQIRETLKQHGHRFKSASDTEVVIKAYMQWGEECLNKFNGMFAFCIWDSNKKKLFLARDRLGIKPLYYYFKNGVFLFGSELKALMAFKILNRELEAESIPLFLHYQYIPTPKTIFKHTFKLPPGHYITYDGNSPPCVKKYWRLPRPEKHNILGMDEALEQLESLLTSTVSNHLISDVPLGALLSGGIDSSLVTALMQKVRKQPTRTFTIGFKEKRYNEAAWASKIAQHLGTNHTEFYVSPEDALEMIPQLPEIYDEPFADASALPTCLVSQLTRSAVTVALSGDGGDEQFAGYVRYWGTREMYQLFKYLPDPLKKTIFTILKTIPARRLLPFYESLYFLLPQRLRITNVIEKWNKLIRLFKEKELQELYRTTICLWSKEEMSVLTGKSLPPSKFESIFGQTQGCSVLSRLMHVDQATYLPDQMLTKVDRASMAASLEVRVPLIDHRIVEFSATLPENVSYQNGTHKLLLRKLLSKYIPIGLFDRPKMGFAVPIEKWFRKELKPLLFDYLSYDRIKKEGLFNPDIVTSILDEHLSGRSNQQYRLWSLLMWEMWRERWLN